MEESRDQRALRASDADRERVADLLRQAASDGRLSLTELDERIDALYAAKTYADLEPVAQDLPGATPTAPEPSSSPAATSREAVPGGRVGGRAGRSEGKAVFAGLVRRGEWVVPRCYKVKAVFGGAELDLRKAQLEADEVEIRVKAVFGGVNIVVPEDVYVIVDGDGVFGGFSDDASKRQPSGDPPVVKVYGRAVFGGVSVQRKGDGDDG
ncbi:cell wall-active antibiotic response 4TMS protein YvqF [Haloactinopolyspora alba]|uniref:Cell wall-active antibiotic response 4TMS protein YvqF n=1 Tax=Haloactinopolyspora alba TaxID=648780 RepID=A0A2P8DX12_9ACTN|nr:DUF1707 domain-containing protein [Haloactinopolyspora alba]PSL01769.1 cell wall-active antibiotic response 4TMS protein YvqF [Haloactinopolyspora alba]